LKKKLLNIFLTIILIISSLGLAGCGKDRNSGLQKVRLNEVVRSTFYAPMYVALSKGFFEEEGLEIELSTGQGADKTMQQVLSGAVDIGFSGPEQVIYIYNQGREDMPIVFAQLTQTDGSFLVGRKPEENFDWKSLKGKTIIGGRPGGVPQMALEYALKLNGLDPNKDVKFVTNLDFTATSGAFKSGTGDYVALFEPTASMLEKDKSGYIVGSIGKEAGNIAYTCFYATESYIKKNPEIIQKFTNAIYKGQQWFASHSDKEVAESIISFFPGSDIDIVTNVIKNYRKINAIASDPTINEADLNKLMDIIQGYKADLIKVRPAFNEIVDNSFAEKAMKNK